MSFSKNSKEEALKIIPTSKENLLHFLCGLYFACGKKENGTIVLSTDLDSLINVLQKSSNKLEEGQLWQETDSRINTNVYYKIYLPDGLTNKILNTAKLYPIEETGFFESRQYFSESEKKEFIRGAFVGCATSSIRISEKPNVKTSSGYHLEFASKNEKFLNYISKLLEEFSIVAKLITRKNVFTLYIKDAEQVSDVLAIVGAFGSVLSLQNEMAKRELRNKINRQTNCESANISKTVDASMRQLDAINKIDKQIGLDKLSDELYQVALLRIANPEESLEMLLKLSDIKLTKSGLNHRLNKIVKIAEGLR